MSVKVLNSGFVFVLLGSMATAEFFLNRLWMGVNQKMARL